MSFFNNSLNTSDYYKILKNFKYKFDKKFLIQNSSAFIGDKSLFKLLICFELIKKIKKVKGDIIEFGVWNGNNLVAMKKIIDFLKIKKRIYGYDHFKGMPKSVGDYKRNRFIGKLSIVKFFLKFFRLKNTYIIKDDIKNLYLHQNKFKKISLIYIDCDLYETTKNILNLLSKKVEKGGIIIFDEGNQNKVYGEGRALNEFYKKNKKNFKRFVLSNQYQPDIYLERIR